MNTPAVVPSTSEGTIYNRIFWLAYLANLSLVTGNALTFRFAELVAYLGGTERIAGQLISAGVAAAIGIRLILGQALDRYGVRKLWIFGGVQVICGSLIFISCRDISWLLYAGRLMFSSGIACAFTCSMVHIQNQVPIYRRTEVIASLGSSGFLGMVIGSQIGDVIFRSSLQPEVQFYYLFGGTACLAFLYIGLVTAITHGTNHIPPPETPSSWKLLTRYWPGSVMYVALIMGMNLTVLTVFLTRFATQHGIKGIGTFFAGYASFAFVMRIVTRHMSRTSGRHKMILLGLTGLCTGQLMFPFVTQEWHFLFPAIASGFGHALLFPAVVSLGTASFPLAYRGTGTTLVLGFLDVGSALFAPILGGIIDYFHPPGFSQMFLFTAGFTLAVIIIYTLTSARTPDNEHQDFATENKSVAPEYKISV
ncbi:MAG: MFS transporter [Planctomycetota bacterium]|nr:MFS transporter [Planctomycetota bacterium]MDA1211772.1 MFS transporter [Planctomycetota bacterium]